MKILAYNPGHDGAAVFIDDHRLIHSLESEKDNGRRYDSLSVPLFLRSLALTGPVDVVAVSGFLKLPASWEGVVTNVLETAETIEAGYLDEGMSGKTDRAMLLLGRNIRQFSSSHVRSHIMCSYGLSPFPQGQPCYALIWEGYIGALYYVDERTSITKIGDIVRQPGAKYAFLYALARPTQPSKTDPAGKIMALAAYGRRGAATRDQEGLIDAIMSADTTDLAFQLSSAKSRFSGSRIFNAGVESQEFKDLAWQFSQALFDRFYQFAKAHVKPGLPLLIAGGCGLNCEWNTQWRQCGLFSDVFVPPCPNDSGVALGAAIDALHHYSGNAKIEWSVYSGDPFIEDVTESPYFECDALNLSHLCDSLLKGDVIGWVQGRYEIGPRALGNRSLLAAPFSTETRDKLNRIKRRESFRPVAPICLEEDFDLHFDHHGPSPHMLYFQHVKSKELAAITHVDGSARAQSVNDRDNPSICTLLREFRRRSGVGVLCNTSLNFNGRGFVNRMSQLFTLARDQGIDGLVVGDRYWKKRSHNA